MRVETGRIVEVMTDLAGGTAARIACRPGMAPEAGRYVLAYAPVQEEAALSVPLFSGAIFPDGFLALPPLPTSWSPGMELVLRGPLGHGFQIPTPARQIALAALGSSTGRLRLLAHQAVQMDLAVTLFTQAPLDGFPLAAESYPLAELPGGIQWADFTAVDVPLELLHTLGLRLGLAPGVRPPCPGQALVYTSMPCGGKAECGVCAVSVRRTWKLACSDGPVFEWEELV